MKQVFHGFGGKLHHDVPTWARDDAFYHIRIRSSIEQENPLTSPDLARPLLESVRYYETNGRWWTKLFLLMPDHLHALIAFAPGETMSKVIGQWKRFHARTHHVIWQEGYFDHRLRDHGVQLDEKLDYILRNPVASGLCAKPEDWPWKYVNSDSTPETHPEQRSR